MEQTAQAKSIVGNYADGYEAGKNAAEFFQSRWDHRMLHVQ